MQMFQKTNAMLTAITMRNAYLETNATAMVNRIGILESATTNQSALIQQITDLGEAIKEQSGKRGKEGKPISEYKALQSLLIFNSERSKFRDWTDKLINALAQVNPDYRQAIKHLNKKLESIDGVINDDNGEDLVKVLNGKMTEEEYRKGKPNQKG